MTGGFETLIYTDCVPGQGLQGTGGLQFQARSAGADSDAMAVVKQSLLYEPPSSWMREGRSVRQYPPSFAHVFDGYLATGAGLYLGQEANGSREGNQLTHSLVTRDPESYQSLRPAQLYRASFWRAAPAPTTTCEPLPSGWDPGPFGVDEARALVLERPDGWKLLVRLVSALCRVHDPQGSRILFISSDPDVVMGWIIAGTLLLPQRTALQIGFKVYSTNPARAPQPVVAVHPAWDSTPARVNHDLGYAVFDLDGWDWSQVPIVPEAESWVDDFCHSDDPIDVLDAIEVAAESGLSGLDAVVLGRAAVLNQRLTEADARVVADWLQDTQPTLLAGYRGSLVDRLVDPLEEWPLDLLLKVDALARSGQVPVDRAASVRVALIRRELVAAARTGRAESLSLPPLNPDLWRPQHRDGAEAAVLRALSEAAPARFDAVLKVAQRFDIVVHLGQIRPAVDSFIDDWVHHPERAYDLRAWPCGPELEDLLVDALNDQVAQRLSTPLELARRWFPQLVHRVENGMFSGPVHEAVLSVAMERASQDKRARLVRRAIAAVESRAADPLGAARTLDALWEFAPPTPAELTWLAESQVREVPVHQAIFADLTRALSDGIPRLPDLLLGRALYDRGLFRPAGVLGERMRRDRRLVAACEALVNADVSIALSHLVDDILDAPPEHVMARAGTVARAVGQIFDVTSVIRILEAFPELRKRYVEALVDLLREPGKPSHAVIAFRLSEHPRMTTQHRKGLVVAVDKWVKSASETRLATASEQVEALSGSIVDKWEEVVEANRGKGMFSWLRFGRR